jgi:hypothetical protein
MLRIMLPCFSWKGLPGKIAFSAAVFLFPAAKATAAPAPAMKKEAPAKFYPGISEDQSMRAHNALRAFFNGNLPRTERMLQELNLIEDHDSLPPLSRLLLVAATGLYLQRDDAGGPEERARLTAVFDSAAKKGLDKCREPKKSGKKRADKNARFPEDRAGHETCLLIRGGIEGFRAILKLHQVSPVQVLNEGLGAVKLLERALAADSTIRDAYLGMGIFHCTAANNSPRVVRSMLGAMGRRVDFQDGLSYLRRSGYEGQYTSTASQLYLIQFLSPYDDELRREKIEIFRSLQETYPLSPYYLFLRWEEALAFYPDSFYNAPRIKRSLERRIRAVETRDYAAKRYLTLVKYQYTLLNAKPVGDYAPDSTLDLGGYSFYPEFIEALRLRREIRVADEADTSRTRRVAEMRAMRKKILARIEKSELTPGNRRLYAWHVRDALREDRLGPAPGRDKGD